MRVTLIQTLATEARDFSRTAQMLLGILEREAKAGDDFLVLPECVFPAYMLSLEPSVAPAALAAVPEFLRRVRRVAAENGVYIVLGIPEVRDGRLMNDAVAIGRDGSIIARASKSNLWHFDRQTFAAGEEFAVFETEFGTMGMMVCADGRIPEIARILALKGARVIFDVVNLVTNARTPAEMDNQQHQFMLKARARENGVHIVVCNKCGVEANITTYMGRSFVVDPQGEILAECSPDRPQALSVAFEPEDAPRAARMEMRRPERYAAIVTQGVAPPAGGPVYAMMARYTASSAAEYAQKAAFYLRGAGVVQATFLLLPGFIWSEEELRAALPALKAAMRPEQTVAFGVSNGAGRQAVLLYDQGAEFRLRDAHMPEGEASPVARLPRGMTVAALFDEEIEVPEIARCAMLQGANLLLYFDGIRAPHTMDFVRTRAAENKVYVLACDDASGDGAYVCVDPNGAVAATTLLGREHAACVTIRPELAADKDVVPGTNILEHRMPKYYEEIVKHERLSD